MEQLIAHEEPTQVSEILPEIINGIEVISSSSSFIEANTSALPLKEIRDNHIIPVFIKDNEPVISHAAFIDTALEAIKVAFNGQMVLSPAVRVSHPIKGRIPEAKNKKAIDLLEREKTLYYERMAFIIELSSISTEIAGNELRLIVGGVKAYNLDNLYSKSGTDQHFKVFIGFQNKVCTNMCVTTDGYLADLKVKNVSMLFAAILTLLEDYNAVYQAEHLQAFTQYRISERQFAQLIGRARMYAYLPKEMRSEIPEMLFGESQINTVCQSYYNDSHFKRESDGSVSLWELYNLFTGANKSTYIDSFLDRGVNAFRLITELQMALQNESSCWYLS